nr:hypothetical protein GCM10020092_039610 [Actinoplanes digitatis]
MAAAASAGAAGFLAAGYKAPDAVAREVAELRETGLPYGLNIFVPSPPPADVAPLEEYRRVLEAEARRYSVTLPPLRLDDDDHYAAKVELAVAAAVPMVSFTFGVPDPAVVAALRGAGSAVLVTVTDVGEARRAAAAGPDALIVQAGAAERPLRHDLAVGVRRLLDRAGAGPRRGGGGGPAGRRGRAAPAPRRTCGACWRRARSRCRRARCSCWRGRPVPGRRSARRCSPGGSRRRW